MTEIRAVARKDNTWPTLSMPLYDDGTHGDTTPNDSVFTNTLATDDLKKTFVLDVYVDGERHKENHAPFFVVSEGEQVSIDSITMLSTTNNKLFVDSAGTSIDLDITTVIDVQDASLSLVEYKVEGSDKSVEIIASDNIHTSMDTARIWVGYNEDELPEDTNEEDLCLYLYNKYLFYWEICYPSGVDPQDDYVWGDTKHFSDFVLFVDKTPPEAVTNHGIVLDSTDVILSWTASVSSDVDHYNIYKSTQEGGFDFTMPYFTTTNTNFVDVEAGDESAGTYLYIVRAVDKTGNEEENMEMIGIVGESTNMLLYTGWNFVGYPSFTETQIGSALAGLGVDYRVKGYSASANDNLELLSDSDYFETEKGYWVWVDSDTTWTVDW